ncbi:type I polyketide synthase [Rugamonas rubra]|uniref:Acyl transferase domain-containing protein n=1 Tax=Rugamonas rubra TaxID=758825 RepID=A0A1I4P603_9BURK|nr:type I polyketide synthase [Rugamonas rubra]SFM23201.1 Acyl transferase domain-containing protein [Rugamonas rubra]
MTTAPSPHDHAGAAAPIAIIGMACRFPGGADDTERFWQLLADGADAMGPVPAERWDLRRFYDAEPGSAGKTQAREAGFLRQPIELFDPLPFGISPREAEGLDPQQRVLLELAWEALEDAGQDFARLRGSATGVFMGGFCLDAMLVRLSPLNREQIDQHTAAAATMTMLANRLSYIFDLRGPSFSVDTACSSSLVAVHNACQSLWSGACELALAGGVNIMQVPEYFVALSHARMLSPLGRCTSFDERAAGYARGEGGGVVVLKPLARALADGDPVLAVIRASGINHDGRTQGITLPNPAAQMALMRDVYRRAGVAPGQVAYVEAHGTGTRAGDKAELEALGSVMAEGRLAGQPCLVGAVKSNIGHLEAASGMAGLIKAVLALQHRALPPNLHLRVANPDIDWAGLCLRLPAAMLPLAAAGADPAAPPYAAVNSFGYGGTNAHLLLQAAPAAPAAAGGGDGAGPWLLPLSACDEAALRAQAGAYAALLRDGPAPLADLLRSAATRRSHLPLRLAAGGEDRAALAAALAGFAAGAGAGPALFLGEAQAHESGALFVYSGMGPQWWGMGRELARREPVFRAALDEVDALVRAQAGWSLLAALGENEADSRVGETAVAQPANLALQVALTRLLAHWGVRPSAVLGHSIGEVAAAWACGALSLADAVSVALRRSEQQQSLAGSGGMLAVGLSAEGAAGLLRDYPAVDLAALNAPRALTLAGPLAELAAIGAELERFEVFQRPLQVEIPYHSRAMEAIRAPLLAALAHLRPQPPRLPWYSTVHGALQQQPCDAAYWWSNVRQPVRFQAAVESALADGHRGFLELGPHPVLLTSLRELLLRRDDCWAAATLQRQQGEAERMLAAAAALHVRGYALDWAALAPPGAPAKLPAYPWQRKAYWKESRRSREDKRGRPGASWLWQRLATPLPAWQVELNTNFFPWLRQHSVAGRMVLPGAAYVAAALALQREVYGEAGCAIEALALRAMLVIEPGRPRSLVSALDGEGGFRIYSHAGEDDDGAWSLHAEGRFRPGAAAPAQRVELDALRRRCPRQLAVADYYQGLAALGLEYGPAFRRITALQVGAGEVLLELDGDAAGDAADPLPPPLLDALFQGLFAALALDSGRPAAMVPVAIASLRLQAPLPARLLAHLVLRRHDAEQAEADLFLLDPQGGVLASVSGARCRALARPRQQPRPEWLHQLAWRASAGTAPLAPAPGPAWLLLGGAAPAEALAERLRRRGQAHLRLALPPAGAEADLAPLRQQLRQACQGLARMAPLGGARLLVFLDEAADPADSYATALRHSLLLLALAQALALELADGAAPPVLCLLTRMGQTVAGAACANPGGAAAWGLLRVLAGEMPAVVCRAVDLGGDQPAVEAAYLEQLFAGDGGGDELALRDGRGYQLALLNGAAAPAAAPPLREFPRHAALRLDGASAGGEQAYWREVAEPLAGAGQVLVQVDSWLLAPGPAAADGAVGGVEWRGRSGPPGAERQVWGLSPAAGALAVATRLALAADAVWPLPPGAFPGAALPLLQAWHGLAVLGRLQAGDSVLLHDAGGANAAPWAAVARRLGARLLLGLPAGAAAAGAAADERLDERLDISRADYAEQLRRRCPAGPDLVLLLGDAAPPPAAALAAGCRLLPLDTALPATLAGALLAAGVQLLPWRPAAAPGAEARAWLERQLADGWRAEPAPPAAADNADINDGDAPAAHGAALAAALALARGGATSRLDLAATPSIRALPAERSYYGLRRHGSYLITGGASGFGLALAEWLAGQGVAHLVLASRRGRVEAADQARLERLRGACRVSLAAVDVTAPDAVARLVADLERDGPPLRGVFHCAMVLADGWLTDLDAAAVRRVLQPKVQGALHLHQATLAMELDCFVLFSSVSALVGNPGQAAYAAANACLDAVAHWRHGLGLPALSVNWGVIGDVGVAARDAALLEQLRLSGMAGLDSADALAALGALLLDGSTQAGVFDMDWARWRRAAPSWPARLHGLAPAELADGGPRQRLQLALAGLAPEAQCALLGAQLRRQLARILGQQEEQLSLHQQIGRLGLDSLSTLEWVLLVNQEWGLNVSAVELLNAASLAALAASLLPRVAP